MFFWRYIFGTSWWLWSILLSRCVTVRRTEEASPSAAHQNLISDRARRETGAATHRRGTNFSLMRDGARTFRSGDRKVLCYSLDSFCDIYQYIVYKNSIHATSRKFISKKFATTSFFLKERRTEKSELDKSCQS